MRKKARLVAFIVLLAIGFLLPLIAAGQGEEDSVKSRVLVIRLDGTVNPGSADYLTTTITRATASGFDALIIELDTPGGLVDSTRDIVQSFLGAQIPIIVYVTPPGARAGSAGVMITMAAHVAAMAPGTNIGAAHPVAGGGEQMDETMTAKITNDTAAWIEGIAEQRGRNKEWAVKAVRDSVSVTATDALKNNVIDLIADNLDDLLAKLDGRQIVLADKSTVTLALSGADIVHEEPGLKHRFLMRLADPNIAYLFMIVGFLGIYAEFSHPGMIFPGVIGAVCFLLFLMSTQVLPINIVGVILIVAAMAMFVAEIKVTSYGALTVGGAVALALGSLFLFDVPEKVVESPDFSFSVSWWLVLPASAGFAAIAAFVAFAVMKYQRRKPSTGSESELGKTARVVQAINHAGGQVKFDGVLWAASAGESIPAGETVEIVEVHGASVRVRRRSNP